MTQNKHNMKLNPGFIVLHTIYSQKLIVFLYSPGSCTGLDYQCLNYVFQLLFSHLCS